MAHQSESVVQEKNGAPTDGMYDIYTDDDSSSQIEETDDSYVSRQEQCDNIDTKIMKLKKILNK